MTVPAEPLAHPLPAQPPNSPFLTQEFKDALTFFRQKGQGDRPAQWQKQWEWEMPIVHIFVFDMMERVYLFGPWAVEHEDLANYLGFADVCFFQLFSHHHNEEENMFQQFEDASGLKIWEANVAQHHAFYQGILSGWLYVRHCRENLQPAPPASPVPPPPQNILEELDKNAYPELDYTKPFDPQALRGQMEKWMPGLTHHMRDEIDTLSPENIEKVGQKADKEIRDAVVKHLQSYDPAWFLCSAFISIPMATCKQMIPLPFLVRRILVPFLFGPKYKGFWRYGQHPENLTFYGTA